jgi:hypothetical protein
MHINGRKTDSQEFNGNHMNALHPGHSGGDIRVDKTATNWWDMGGGSKPGNGFQATASLSGNTHG